MVSGEAERRFVRVRLQDGREGWVDPADQPPFKEEQDEFRILLDGGTLDMAHRHEIVQAHIVGLR